MFTSRQISLKAIIDMYSMLKLIAVCVCVSAY